MCLSILSEEKDWVPTITVKQVLLGIQDLLDNPNLGDPAQREAFIMCRDDRAAYIERVKSLAKSYVGGRARARAGARIAAASARAHDPRPPRHSRRTRAQALRPAERSELGRDASAHAQGQKRRARAGKRRVFTHATPRRDGARAQTPHAVSAAASAMARAMSGASSAALTRR